VGSLPSKKESFYLSQFPLHWRERVRVRGRIIKEITMRNKLFFNLIAIVFIISFTVPTLANMGSENYSIVESVFSNGGGPTVSDNYAIDSTLGQPSPLMENIQPISPNYGLYPGFWYPVEEATLIQLASFTASPGSKKIVIKWSAESEIDNAGFNLYRSESENGEYNKINDSIIPARGSATQGAEYEFVDANVKNRKTYYYKLEDIDLNGVPTLHGPIKATPRLIYGINKSAER
jgi:hypothetical protein